MKYFTRFLFNGSVRFNEFLFVRMRDVFVKKNEERCQFIGGYARLQPTGGETAYFFDMSS